ncbi:MAG: GntR family transcriptional regulator [Pseudomonadota bacterium]
MNRSAQPALPDGIKSRSVYLALRDQIASGRVADGETLPGEQKLAESFGVSRVTVRRALDALSDAGLVERRAGSGTRVRNGERPGGAAEMDANTLLPQLVEMGQSTTARLLSFCYGPAPDQVAKAMRLGPGASVQIATRVRIADATPFSHLTTYVPAPIARSYSEDDLARTPLFALLERSGVTVAEAHQTVSATLAAPDVAEALEVAVGSALLSLRRVVRDADGNGVEYLSALYRPDMFRLEMPLSRVGDGASRHWELAIGKGAGASG